MFNNYLKVAIRNLMRSHADNADSFAGIERMTRVMEEPRALVGYGELRNYESRFYWADANVFEVFNLPLLMGDFLASSSSLSGRINFGIDSVDCVHQFCQSFNSTIRISST